MTSQCRSVNSSPSSVANCLATSSLQSSVLTRKPSSVVSISRLLTVMLMVVFGIQPVDEYGSGSGYPRRLPIHASPWADPTAAMLLCGRNIPQPSFWPLPIPDSCRRMDSMGSRSDSMTLRAAMSSPGQWITCLSPHSILRSRMPRCRSVSATQRVNSSSSST